MNNKEVSKDCLICGATFYKTRTKSWKCWNEKAKYCSRRCSALSVRDTTIARNKAGKGKKLTEEHKQKLKEKRKGRQPALGMKHSEEFKERMSREYSGSKSPHWKGGKTPLKELLRSNSRYKEWRTKVFHRDLYTCQHCGQKGGYLEVDHIIEYRRIIKAFDISSFEEAIDNFLLWEVSNGRTLCKDCHIKRHKRVV